MYQWFFHRGVEYTHNTFLSDVNNLDNYRTIHEPSKNENATLPNASKSSVAVVRSSPRKRKQSSPAEHDNRNVKKPRKSKEATTLSKSKSDVTPIVAKTKPEVRKSQSAKTHLKTLQKTLHKISLDLDVNREIVPQLASIGKTPTAVAKNIDTKSQRDEKPIEDTG